MLHHNLFCSLFLWLYLVYSNYCFLGKALAFPKMISDIVDEQ